MGDGEGGEAMNEYDTNEKGTCIIIIRMVLIHTYGSVNPCKMFVNAAQPSSKHDNENLSLLL